MDIYGQIRKNNARTWLFLSFFIGLLLLIGYGFDYFYGASYRMPVFTLTAVIISFLSSLGGYFFGDRWVLSSTHARPPIPPI